MLTRRGALVSGGAWAASEAFARSPSPARAVARDVDILRQAFTQLHPGLNRYATSEGIDFGFAQLSREFLAHGDLTARFLALARFAGAVRCGHTHANPFNQRRAVRLELFEQANKPPFCFAWIDGRMIVTRNLTPDTRLSPGSVITELNGRRPAELLERLLPYARADGSNDAKRRALLSVSGASINEEFDLFYPLLFPVADGIYRMRARPPRGGSFSVEVPATTMAARKAAMGAPETSSDTPLWSFSFPRERIGLAIMPTWTTYNSSWDWRGFIENMMDQLIERQAKGLVLDLRLNEGGEDCGDAVLARIIEREIAKPAYERRVRFCQTPPSLDAVLDTWDDSFRRLGENAEDLGDGYFRIPRDDAVETIAPSGRRFMGTLVVLTSAQNSSATFQFAHTVKLNRIGTLVGASTGGNLRGINGGAYFFVRLPESGLECDLPLIGTFPRTPQPDAGLAPDIQVEPNARDIAEGYDRALETALRLIGSA